jgi:protein gp37
MPPMGADTRIEWATHTFNPWSGCQKVSPACDHCYAETQAKRAPRTFGGWGPGAERKRTSESYWRQPLLWNKRAAKDGARPRVFCASMADVFDNAVPEGWRRELWELIAATPYLDWLLLTKRPQNIAKMLPPLWGRGWANVWLGTTVENQAEADRRIPHLLAMPAAKRFLSCEPLLGPADLRRIQYGAAQWTDALSGMIYYGPGTAPIGPRIDWVIAGGESGAHARPSHPDWFRSLRDQCQAAGVPFFFKQWGEWRPICQGHGDWYRHLYRSNVQAKEGEDQAALDEARGRHCIVDQLCLRDDGRHVGMTEPGAWVQGTRPVLAFKTGKKAADAMLDGREWREVPA